MNNNPLISIVITTWNGEKYLIECISSLLNQSYKNMEIILVDNASSDRSVELVNQNFQGIQVIQNSKNLGFAEGTNIGILRAKGELVALFNQDAVAEKHWLENLINEIKSSDSWQIFKIMAEFVHGFEKLGRIGPCVSIFGSARTSPDNKYFKLAEEIAFKLTQHGFGIITGGGPGIMEGAPSGENPRGCLYD